MFIILYFAVFVCWLLYYFATTFICLLKPVLKPKFTNSAIYTGIEVGSKGVKMSVMEIGKNAQSNGAFNILKDTSVNTDFITFSPATFSATLNGFTNLYNSALNRLPITLCQRIFTVISSGVKMQAEKDEKTIG